MNNVTKTLLIGFVFLFVLASASTVLADPTVVQVTIDPAKPLPMSTITFNATILCNETIREVRLIVYECLVDLCSVYGFNISMDKITNDTYQAHCTLINEETIQIKYNFEIACNETGYATNTTFMLLTSDSQDSVPTPGFEIPLLVLSMVLILVFNQWKRKSGGKP